MQRAHFFRRHWRRRLITGGLVPLAAAVAILVGAFPLVAAAHSVMLHASVMVKSRLPSGASPVQIILMDHYNSPIPGAQIMVKIDTEPGKGFSESLFQETGEGVYTGEIHFPKTGPSVLRLEAELPDGPYLAQTRVTLGADGRPARDIGLMLRHKDSVLVTPLGWFVIATFAAAVAGMVVVVVNGFRQK